MKPVEAALPLVFGRRQNGSNEIVQDADQNQNEEERLCFGLQLQADDRYECDNDQEDEGKETNVVQWVLKESDFEVVEDLKNRIGSATKIESNEGGICKAEKKADVGAGFRTKTPRYHRIDTTGSNVSVRDQSVHTQRRAHRYNGRDGDL